MVTRSGNFRADSATIRLDRLYLQRTTETLLRTAYSAVDPSASRLPSPPIGTAKIRQRRRIVNPSSTACRLGCISVTHEDAAAAGQTVIGHELIAPPFTRR